jgi:hypothetical protein
LGETLSLLDLVAEVAQFSAGKWLSEHMVPVPRGKSLGEISQGLLEELKRRETTRRHRSGISVEELMNEERKALRELPATPFDPRKVAPVCVSSKATVQIEGAVYSVPTGWARRDAAAYIGVEDIRLVCAGQQQTIVKQPWGVRTIKYRHYLPELARKPQAVRQVAPELLKELGEPFGDLWKMLVQTHGEREAARVLARVIGAMVDHGEDAVREALEKTAATEQFDLLRLSQLVHKLEEPVRVSVVHHRQFRNCDYEFSQTPVYLNPLRHRGPHRLFLQL